MAWNTGFLAAMHASDEINYEDACNAILNSINPNYNFNNDDQPGEEYYFKDMRVFIRQS